MLFDPTLEIPRYSWKLQRSYMWEVMLPDIGGVSGLFVSTYCQDIKFGDYGMEEVASLRYGAYKAKYAGLMDIPDLTLTFLRPVPDQVTAFFYAWRQLIITNEGYYNVKGNYAKSIYVYLYDTTGAITNKIQLVGCFPKDVPAWDFSYDSESISKFSITLSVDRIAFGEFVSPVFAQDTVQPFTRVDISETSSIKPQQRSNIAPPQRFSVATGSVPASNFAASSIAAVIGQGLAGAVIKGVTSLGAALAGSIVAPIRPNPAPAIAPPPVASPSIVDPKSIPVDVALSLGRSISTFNNSPTRVMASTNVEMIPLTGNGSHEIITDNQPTFSLINSKLEKEVQATDVLTGGTKLYPGGKTAVSQ